MLGLLETVDALEVAWTVSSLVAVVGSARSWRRACRDLAAARARLDGKHRRYVLRAFKRDVAVMRGRIVASAASLAVGVIAAAQASPTARTLTGWLSVALLFAWPFYLVWRNAIEETDRRRTIHDLERDRRAETYQEGGAP